jgi:hypothetical protein
MTLQRRIALGDQLRGAFSHTLGELGLENIQPSFLVEYEQLQKAHDAIHECILLAPLMFPSQAETDAAWQGKSAFFAYQWEAFHHAHRSLIEALCGYYNVAFTLLRTTLELLIKGAFWECLAHKRYRENAQVLDDNKAGRRLRRLLEQELQKTPGGEDGLERISAGIYDVIGPLIERQDFRIFFSTIVLQLEQWDIFLPIHDANKSVYNRLYRKLSSDVHVIPDRTDIGRRLADAKAELFEQELLPDTLCEYAGMLHKTIDLGVLIELNLLADLIEGNGDAKGNLRERLPFLEQLDLVDSLKRARQLVEV